MDHARQKAVDIPKDVTATTYHTWMDEGWYELFCHWYVGVLSSESFMKSSSESSCICLKSSDGIISAHDVHINFLCPFHAYSGTSC